MGASVDIIFVHEEGADLESSRSWMQELDGDRIHIRAFSMKRLLRKPGLIHRMRELTAITPGLMWPNVRDRHRLISMVQSLQPDLVYVFGEYPLMFCFEGYQDPIRLIAGDPPNDSIRHSALVRLRSRDVTVRERLSAILSLAIAWNMKRLTNVQGRSLPPVGFHDLREVTSAKRHGWQLPYFARPEVPDWGINVWQSNAQRLASHPHQARIRRGEHRLPFPCRSSRYRTASR